MRISVLIVLLSGGAGCSLQPIDFERWGIAEPGPHAARDLRARMDEVEERIFRDFVTGDGRFRYRLPLQPRPDTGLELDLPDQACWTGYLLAALAFRDAHDPGPETGARQRLLVRALSRLERATGRPGFFARELVPSALVDEVAHDLEVWQPAHGIAGHHCRVDTSKDQVAGVVFGLVAAARLSRDPGVRRDSRVLLELIARRLEADDLRLRGPDGEVTRFGDLRGRILGVPIGVNAAISLAALHCSARLGSDPLWRRQVAARSGRLASCLVLLHFELLGIRNYNNDLMAAAGLAALGLVELPPDLCRRVRAALRDFLPAFEGEGNAFFCSVAALHGVRRSQEERRALRNLLSAPIDLDPRAADPDRVEGLARQWLPGRKGSRRLREALPIAERSVSSFLWKSDPREVPEPRRHPVRVSSVDLLVAYWSGVHSGWIELAQLQSLP